MGPNMKPNKYNEAERTVLAPLDPPGPPDPRSGPNTGEDPDLGTGPEGGWGVVVMVVFPERANVSAR